MSSALRRAGAPLRPLVFLGQTAQRRFAGGTKYAEFRVKKNNWVEQNEALRENQFYNWTFTKKNVVPVLLMVVVIPAAILKLLAAETHHLDATRQHVRRSFWGDDTFSIRELAKNWPPQKIPAPKTETAAE